MPVPVVVVQALALIELYQGRLTVVLDGDEAAWQWRAGDLTRRRRVLSTILDRIIVRPGKDLPPRDGWKTPAFPTG